MPAASPICWACLLLPVATSDPFPILLLPVLAPQVLTLFPFRALGGSDASLGTLLPAAIVRLQVAWPATSLARRPSSRPLGHLALIGYVTHEGSHSSSVWDSVSSESRKGQPNRTCRTCRSCA